jgi:regulatory protein
MDTYEKYLNYILHFLSFRQRTEKEIKDKLIEKKAPQEIREQIVNFLKQQKFINDAEFARLWIQSRKSFRIKSKKAIKMELLKKGIAVPLINEALAGTDDEENSGINDQEQAIKLVHKRINKYRHLPKQELYQKLGGFLARRGFSWETIKSAIDKVHRNIYP